MFAMCLEISFTFQIWKVWLKRQPYLPYMESKQQGLHCVLTTPLLCGKSEEELYIANILQSPVQVQTFDLAKPTPPPDPSKACCFCEYSSGLHNEKLQKVGLSTESHGVHSPS